MIAAAPMHAASATRTMDALRRIVRALRMSHAQSTRSQGVSTAGLFVLRQIAQEPGISLRELSARTGSSASSVSEVVAKLVRAGLVQRAIAEHDRRSVSLKLTSAGLSLVGNSPETVQERLLSALHAMSPAQQRTIADALEGWVGAAELSDVAPKMFFDDSVS